MSARHAARTVRALARGITLATCVAACGTAPSPATTTPTTATPTAATPTTATPTAATPTAATPTEATSTAATPTAATEACTDARNEILDAMRASRDASSCTSTADCAVVTGPGHPDPEYDEVVAAVDAVALDARAEAHLASCGAFHHHEAIDAFRVVEAACANGHCTADTTTFHIEE